MEAGAPALLKAAMRSMVASSSGGWGVSIEIACLDGGGGGGGGGGGEV